MPKLNEKTEKLDAWDTIAEMLRALDADDIAAMAKCGIDGPADDVATLNDIYVNDDGEVELFLDLDCTATVTLGNLLNHNNRAHELDELMRGLKNRK